MRGISGKHIFRKRFRFFVSALPASFLVYTYVNEVSAGPELLQLLLVAAVSAVISFFVAIPLARAIIAVGIACALFAFGILVFFGPDLGGLQANQDEGIEPVLGLIVLIVVGVLSVRVFWEVRKILQSNPYIGYECERCHAVGQCDFSFFSEPDGGFSTHYNESSKSFDTRPTFNHYTYVRCKQCGRSYEASSFGVLF